MLSQEGPPAEGTDRLDWTQSAEPLVDVLLSSCGPPGLQLRMLLLICFMIDVCRGCDTLVESDVMFACFYKPVDRKA